MLILYIVLFFIGMFVLVKSSDYLVEGASSVASKFKISPIVIGLTIVAFGTSAPELVVSVSAALSGSTDIALGNVVGSNIFNILIILGISAILYPIHINKGTIWKEIPFSLLGVIITFLLAARIFLNTNQPLDFSSATSFTSLGLAEGLILLSVFVVFMYYIFGIAKTNGDNEEIKELSTSKSIMYMVFGLLGLSLSSKFLVTDSAVEIARSFNISESLIGLTLVSVGTSLPELATSVSAALKKNSDIAIGNIVGSNIFNITFILGATLLIKPIGINGQNIVDLIVLIFTTLILFTLIFVFQKYRLNKIEGASMIALYLVYMVYLIGR